MDDAQLQTIWQQRQPRYRAASVAEPLAMLMKQRLSRRVKQLGQLGLIWAELVPDAIREHAALERFCDGARRHDGAHGVAVSDRFAEGHDVG